MTDGLMQTIAIKKKIRLKKKKRIGDKTMINSLIFMYATDINKIIIR